MESSTEEKTYWRKCTTCKKPIGFQQKYWICSVSTCNRVRTGLVFCSVECFDAHVPVLNHRDAGAFEKRAPSEAQWKAEQQVSSAASAPSPKPALSSSPASTHVSQPPPSVLVTSPSQGGEQDILVVVSKVKAYIRSRSEMNTSDRVMDLLSDRIRAMADEAIRRAAQDERKTVLDRDIH